MFVLRCTGKLLGRLRQSPMEHAVSTTTMGDWYANLLFAPRAQLVLFVSERSLLPIVVPAREAGMLVPRFRETLRSVLRSIGVDGGIVERELAAMDDVQFAKTTNRQVLGSMTDFAHQLRGRPISESLIEVSLELAEAPCGPVGMKRPLDVAAGILSSSTT